VLDLCGKNVAVDLSDEFVVNRAVCREKGRAPANALYLSIMRAERNLSHVTCNIQRALCTLNSNSVHQQDGQNEEMVSKLN